MTVERVIGAQNTERQSSIPILLNKLAQIEPEKWIPCPEYSETIQFDSGPIPVEIKSFRTTIDNHLNISLEQIKSILSKTHVVDSDKVDIVPTDYSYRLRVYLPGKKDVSEKLPVVEPEEEKARALFESLSDDLAKKEVESDDVYKDHEHPYTGKPIHVREVIKRPERSVNKIRIKTLRLLDQYIQK
jgi:hypothetical protein